jgi:hypothetical protein
MDNVTLIRIVAGSLAIVLALSTAIGAKKRGMNPVLWFLAVLFFPLVAVPVYFAVRGVVSSSEARPLAFPSRSPDNPPVFSGTGLPSLCPHCGKYYRGQAKYCPICGNSQSLETSARAVSQS